MKLGRERFARHVADIFPDCGRVPYDGLVLPPGNFAPPSGIVLTAVGLLGVSHSHPQGAEAAGRRH